jgi:hypothetical protein
VKEKEDREERKDAAPSYDAVTGVDDATATMEMLTLRDESESK